MRILYDYSAFVMQSRGGVSRVLYELMGHVSGVPGIECKVFAGFHRNQYLRDAPKHIKRHVIGWHLPEWMVKQRIFMPVNRWLFKYYARKFNPDVCHYTYFDTPHVPSGCKVVVTMHDMIHELFADMFGTNEPHPVWKKNAVGRADGVICVSENTKKDLERFIDLGGKKVSVIHHGNSLATVAPKKIDCSYSYLLYVGTRAVEYKNFDLVLRALARCMDRTALHLVCFGGGAFSAAERKRIDEVGLVGRVHQMGGSDAVLAGYYAGAQALIYPSKYEGFGLPPIEAMGLGCPVLSSTAPPMPEIVGDAGWYFEPDDVEKTCEQILALANEELRTDLIVKGSRREKMFTWAQAAEEAVAFYRELL